MNPIVALNSERFQFESKIVTSNEKMNRQLKFTALLIIGILAARPVLSNLYCAVRMITSCAQKCPMGAVAAAECPMTRMVGASPNCCAYNSFEAVLRRAAHEKTKVEPLSFAAVQAEAATSDVGLSISAVAVFPRTSSPPRYVVNRVFRI